MTREEAWNRIDAIIARHEIDDEYVTITSLLDYDALRLARKLLEQEHCDDCISRQAAIDQTYLWSKDEFLRVTNPFDYLRKRINYLPSVTPVEKVGHWEWVQYDSNPNIGNWHCSECRTIIPHMPEETDNTPIYKWCPMCGNKKMQEVEE